MNLELSKNDVDFIVLLLEKELKSAMVERHHTATNEYKKIVEAKETQLESLIKQFKH